MVFPVKEVSIPNEPVLTKDTFTSMNDLYEVGSSCMQGWRKQMEDSHTHILSLLANHQTSFFAVYDGHGGDKVANYAAENLHWYITKRPEYKENNIPEAMKNGFLELDTAMKDFIAESVVGSTAIVIIIKDEMLYCGNVGDSRAIAGIDGSYKVLSLDHKPSKVKERQRIRAAGGFVTLNRVNGKLATSRAFGDYKYKKSKKSGPEEQIVTACPDIMIKEIDSSWEFIVMASDGIWDILNSEEVYKFVHEKISAGMKPSEICEELIDTCFAMKSKDNMTVIIIHLLNGQSNDVGNSNNKNGSNRCNLDVFRQHLPEIEMFLHEKGENPLLQSSDCREFSQPFQQGVKSSFIEQNECKIENNKCKNENLHLQKCHTEIGGVLDSPSIKIEQNEELNFTNFPHHEREEKSVNKKRIITSNLITEEEKSLRIPSLMDLNVPCPPKFNKEKRQKKNLSSIPSLLDLKVSNPFECLSCRKLKDSSSLPSLLNFTISLHPQLSSGNRKEGLDLAVSIQPKCTCNGGKYSSGIP